MGQLVRHAFAKGMKRLTPTMRKWLLHRQRMQQSRAANRKIGRGNPRSRPIPGRREFLATRAKLPPVVFHDNVMPKFAAFFPPKTFSLIDTYEQTLAFIMDFQRIFFEAKPRRVAGSRQRREYADFSRIERIDAGAGLVLAAEIDCFARAKGRPTQVFDHLWQANVHEYFTEAGLFEMLGVDPRAVKTAPSAQPTKRTLKFVSGQTRSGHDAEQLLQRLETLTERGLSRRPFAYAAIAEALANVDHAYPTQHVCWPYEHMHRWWASGFWEPYGNRVGLQLYDRGAGIPATLPRQKHFPGILKFLDPERTDAGLVSAALEYGRTSTDKPGRGKGLGEMADWIERTGTGFLRILSGGGLVTYRPGGTVEKRNFHVPFRGTLVEWEVALDE